MSKKALGSSTLACFREVTNQLDHWEQASGSSRLQHIGIGFNNLKTSVIVVISVIVHVVFFVLPSCMYRSPSVATVSGL